jgi:hypothetical protein
MKRNRVRYHSSEGSHVDKKARSSTYGAPTVFQCDMENVPAPTVRLQFSNATETKFLSDVLSSVFWAKAWAGVPTIVLQFAASNQQAIEDCLHMMRQLIDSPYVGSRRASQVLHVLSTKDSFPSQPRIAEDGWRYWLNCFYHRFAETKHELLLAKYTAYLQTSRARLGDLLTTYLPRAKKLEARRARTLHLVGRLLRTNKSTSPYDKVLVRSADASQTALHKMKLVEVSGVPAERKLDIRDLTNCQIKCVLSATTPTGTMQDVGHPPPSLTVHSSIMHFINGSSMTEDQLFQAASKHCPIRLSPADFSIIYTQTGTPSLLFSHVVLRSTDFIVDFEATMCMHSAAVSLRKYAKQSRPLVRIVLGYLDG